MKLYIGKRTTYGDFIERWLPENSETVHSAWMVKRGTTETVTREGNQFGWPIGYIAPTWMLRHMTWEPEEGEQG